MTRRDAARIIALNALVSVALFAAAARWILPPSPAIAVLDVAELYHLKESRVGAILANHDLVEAERLAAIERAGTFGTDLATQLDTLSAECHCLVLSRGAVVATSAPMQDLTAELRRRLGL